MIQANTVLEAWDKTLETKDFTHLEKYLSADFQVEDTDGELDNLENIKSWCIAGGLRINNFKQSVKTKTISLQRMMLSRRASPNPMS